MGNTAHSAYTLRAVSGRLINAVIAVAAIAVCWDIISLILLVKNYTIVYWLFLHVILFLKVGGLWLFYSRKQPGWYLLALPAAYTSASVLLKAILAIAGHHTQFDPLWCFDMLPAAVLLALILHPAVRASFKINTLKTAAAVLGGLLLAGILLFVHL